MKRTTAIRCILVLAIGLFSTSSTDAQIDYRVGRTGGDGRALDANPLVGGRGVNRPVGSPFRSGFEGNAIISGNVTGLGGFKAYTPVLQSNRFRGSLPSLLR